MTVRLTPQNCRNLSAALHRAIDWSDLGDNEKHHGWAWAMKERAFLKRLRRLQLRLQKGRS
jgi:hypothetical protein